METIGNKLKAAREKQKMTVSDVAKTIRAKTDYVAAIEKDEFHKLIAPVYARGFIKLYAQCVRLDAVPLLRQFDAADNREERAPVKPVQESKTKKEAPVLKKRRPVKINFAGLIDPLRKIKLPDIRRFKISALKPVALPGKKWLALIIAAAICVVILPILARHITLPEAKIRVSPACRWIADPPGAISEYSCRKNAE